MPEPSIFGIFAEPSEFTPSVRSNRATENSLSRAISSTLTDSSITQTRRFWCRDMRDCGATPQASKHTADFYYYCGGGGGCLKCTAVSTQSHSGFVSGFAASASGRHLRGGLEPGGCASEAPTQQGRHLVTTRMYYHVLTSAGSAPSVERSGLPMYMRSLRWALAVMAVLLAVSTVAIVALASRAGARCQPCPQGWMWSMEHCYYLSAEAEAWEASQAFCSAHHATLPLLRHTQDFLSRYPVTKYSWVGARRGPQGWHWIDGTPLPPQLLPEEDQQEPDLNCGGLEGGKFVASDCASPRPWVCARGTK